MNEQWTTFDAAKYLETDADRIDYLRQAFETGESSLIANAVGVVARAQGMSEIAKKTGAAREALYTSLSESGNPTLKTVLAVLAAMGVKLAPIPA